LVERVATEEKPVHGVYARHIPPLEHVVELFSPVENAVQISDVGHVPELYGAKPSDNAELALDIVV
jgi:hypothetical protein